MTVSLEEARRELRAFQVLFVNKLLELLGGDAPLQISADRRFHQNASYTFGFSFPEYEKLSFTFYRNSKDGVIDVISNYRFIGFSSERVDLKGLTQEEMERRVKRIVMAWKLRKRE